MPSNPSVFHANRHPGTKKATMRIVERELQSEIVSDWKSWKKKYSNLKTVKICIWKSVHMEITPNHVDEPWC